MNKTVKTFPDGSTWSVNDVVGMVAFTAIVAVGVAYVNEKITTLNYRRRFNKIVAQM